MATLAYTDQGETLLQYTTATGSSTVIVDNPTTLLTTPFDEPAEPLPLPYPFADTTATLAACFTDIPLNPHANWQPPTESTPYFREAFDAYLQMMRQPIESRWAVRGEPEHFLMGGYRKVNDTGWILFALTIACGKPAVLCFRCEDCIRALPAPIPFKTMQARFASDANPEETVIDLPWDTRIRLDVANDGGAIIDLTWDPLP